MAVIVKLNELKEQVEVKRWNRKQLMEHYGLNSNQLTKLLKKANLKVSRVKEAFILVDENEEKIPSIEEDFIDENFVEEERGW